ncbi:MULTISPECIES: class I SAM-dependent methyltransferase [Bradyrhizobium]|jgi:SAM-dependent methyltransferase|uniref:class I SAM-dependent methyltransferase n=1 Tax=Bradyrhizobium TaxID=374 RepID=UPI000482A857|nr:MULTISPECIES: class I SAM-dependent methyltransferase [Bradyrhizobium]MCS3449724.1 ubiquinone/menaquinone biosynthesis C-methylase UbiE [Bradyrhizobium elkanii]MCS3559133.1 ubiquinone/menaquinone biosynthesis C-methylase UbiE [Bradyrhizobium elkanii]MCW2151021.1 ubiquinone/menaquinone biosynthesis C-methylase UbiE [Bradyrhizobium elkanii]MCW2358933.1 ubiquinone/menaquinone biosynthesis C-methylase UbiE [Bradyrhizobium elkanii]MCW2374752.1 ubiquinone/menaquinone biosynthesis C-methylase UbiE
MNAGHPQNADQIAYWNGPGGQRWATRQAAQDIVLQPVLDLLVDRAAPKAGERVVDVGCGSGASSFALAAKVAPAGHVLGVDVSEPMLTRARQSAPQGLPVEFALADATVYPFVSESFDLLASRFGVMFFADPVVSFANLHKAMKPTGRLAFACWQEPRENPFFMTPLAAVYKHVPKLPPLGPEDPGPFAFASEARVKRILGEAGFSGIAMEPCRIVLDVATGRGIDAAIQGALEIGPASRALEGHPDEVRATAIASMREALAPFVKGDAVLLPGAIWIVTARA